jgi:flagellar biosynthesis chaperone FliJ
MQKFRYRLDPLLEQKRKEKEAADEVLGSVKQQWAAEREREQQMKHRVDELTDAYAGMRRKVLRPDAGSAMSAVHVSHRVAFLKRLAADTEAARDEVFAQQLVVEEAASRVLDAKRTVDEASRRVDILEKHRGKLEKRFYAAAEAKEALELDELGNAMYLTKRRTR